MSITERPAVPTTPAATNTQVIRPGVPKTGFDNPTNRLVRVLKQSHLNGAVFEPGDITYWPAGVEVLGTNLEEYKG